MDTQFSELIGSFIRTSDFPLEANYIFPTEEDLKKFYSDELNVKTLHKGLLRVVENDEEGNQALFWVTKKYNSDELEFTKLISANNLESIIEELENLESKLEQEIKIREKADKALWGTNNPSEIPEDLNSILDLSKAVSNLKELVEEEINNTHTDLKDALKATVGTEEDDILLYLQTLPYSSLTEVSDALNAFLNQYDEEEEGISTLPELKSFLDGYTDKDNLKTIIENISSGLTENILGNPIPSEEFRTLRGIEDFVRLLKTNTKNAIANLQKEINDTQTGVGLDSDGKYSPDKTTNYLQGATSVMNALRILDALIAEAQIKVSEKAGNQIVIEQDGVYHKVDIDYRDGRLDLIINGSIVKYFDLGLSGLVSDGYYDSENEEIVIELSLPNGQVKKLKIAAKNLIEEWQVYNNPDSAITLNKERNTIGKDVLTADVNISNNKYNILEKTDSGKLLVRGTADNIIFGEGDLSVQEKIKQIEEENSQQDSLLEDLQSQLNKETERALEVERALQDNINNVNEALKDEIERAKEAEEDLATELRHYTDTVKDIESHPIVKAIIEPDELPKNPKSGDAYLVKTGNSYYLHEYNGKNWEIRILHPGTIVSIPDGEVYKITSTGLDHILEESDLTESDSMTLELDKSGESYKLTANLKVDSDINNLSDILLSISESGLSAKIIVSEYD